MTLTFAFGDIHGCYEQFNQLLQKVDSYPSKGKKIKLLFVGDYIDRGPDSKKVVDTIIDLQNDKYQKGIEVIALKGNHEDMMMERMAGWYHNGGYATEKSYGDKHPMDTEHRSFYQGLKLFHDDGKRFFCHAGVTHEPLESNDKMTLIWVREPFLSNKKKWSRLIVHGHTPSYTVEVKENRINLDSACVFGGKLSCAVFNDEHVEPITFLDVPGLKERPGP